MQNTQPKLKNKTIKPKITTVSIEGDVSFEQIEAAISRSLPQVTTRLWAKRKAKISVEQEVLA